jgi:DNA modification methylase
MMEREMSREPMDAYIPPADDEERIEALPSQEEFWWEGGMPGYLIWLNARLYEMKRLLKKTGSIYVHCDWHASHYIKADRATSPRC